MAVRNYLPHDVSGQDTRTSFSHEKTTSCPPTRGMPYGIVYAVFSPPFDKTVNSSG